MGHWASEKKEYPPLPLSPTLPLPLSPFAKLVANYARYKLMIEITLNLQFCFPSAYPQERTILREGLCPTPEVAGILFLTDSLCEDEITLFCRNYLNLTV